MDIGSPEHLLTRASDLVRLANEDLACVVKKSPADMSSRLDALARITALLARTVGQIEKEVPPAAECDQWDSLANALQGAHRAFRLAVGDLAQARAEFEAYFLDM